MIGRTCKCQWARQTVTGGQYPNPENGGATEFTAEASGSVTGRGRELSHPKAQYYGRSRVHAPSLPFRVAGGPVPFRFKLARGSKLLVIMTP